MFREQLDWLAPFGAATATEILSTSIRNGWQGLFEPKRGSGPAAPSKPHLAGMTAAEFDRDTEAWAKAQAQEEEAF